MNITKLRKLRQQFHDVGLEIRASHRCGKTIMSTQAAADLVDMIERLVAAVIEDDTVEPH